MISSDFVCFRSRDHCYYFGPAAENNRLAIPNDYFMLSDSKRFQAISSDYRYENIAILRPPPLKSLSGIAGGGGAI